MRQTPWRKYDCQLRLNVKLSLPALSFVVLMMLNSPPENSKPENQTRRRRKPENKHKR